jgi:hypothetical protein
MRSAILIFLDISGELHFQTRHRRRPSDFRENRESLFPSRLIVLWFNHFSRGPIRSEPCLIAGMRSCWRFQIGPSYRRDQVVYPNNHRDYIRQSASKRHEEARREDCH